MLYIEAEDTVFLVMKREGTGSAVDQSCVIRFTLWIETIYIALDEKDSAVAPHEDDCRETRAIPQCATLLRAQIGIGRPI